METQGNPDNCKLDYPEAAIVIHLWLKDFCDESLPFPDMIAEAARKASKRIEQLEKGVKALNEIYKERVSLQSNI